MSLLLRLSFGLSLLLVGVAHYMGLQGFTLMVSDGLGPLTPLGMLAAYILPALMIVGGGLLVLGMYTDVAVWASGIALAVIPVGVLLKPVLSGVSLADIMPAVINTYIWLLVWAFVVKCTHTCGPSCEMK
jgi:uncharacterized membrane protein YphA (DoxX/SURF4 family)